MTRISNEAARNFLVNYQNLNGCGNLCGRDGVATYMQTVRCIQFDPLDVVGRNPDLVLQSRVENYRPEMLADLLYKERTLIDAADKVIVVTNQCRAAVFATNRFYESISGASSEKFLYVCSNFDRDSDNALTDSSLRLRFSINEYLQHFHGFDKKNLDALSKEKDVQKLAYLLI